MRSRSSSTRTKRVSIALALGALGAACGFQFAPGDYGGAAGDGGPNGSSDGGPNTTDGPGLIDGPKLADGAPAPVNHLLVVAGERDNATDVNTSDVWTAAIYADGSLGEFVAESPTFFRGVKGATTFANGHLFIGTRGATSTRAVEWVAFDGGIVGPWKGSNVESAFNSNWASAFAGSSYLSLGGQHTEQIPDGGGSKFVIDNVIYVSQLADAGYTGLNDSDTTLPNGAYNLTTFNYKDFIYTFGGNNSAGDQISKVYVARVDNVDPAKAVSNFTETTRMTNPTNGQPYGMPSQAIVCATTGRIFVIGGQSNDIVITAPLNETDGTIGEWKGAPKLPGALRNAGCAVFNDTIHLIGGFGATSRTDRILRAPIKADGTLGEWEISAGAKLPAPRSSIIAIVY